MDRSSKQNINKDIVSLNNTLEKRDLLIHVELFIPMKQNTHSFQVHMEHFQRCHMEGHKASFNKFKKIEIISSIFSDHKGLKLETNHKGKNPKHSKSWRLNGMLLNNKWVKNEIREEIKKFLEINENELTTTQNLLDTDSMMPTPSLPHSPPIAHVHGSYL